MTKTKLITSNLIHQKTRTLQLHPLHCLGPVSSGLLSLITLALVFPFVNHASSALTTYPVDINPSIAIALDQEAVMDITPSSTGTFGTSTAKLTVSSNRSSGYKIYLNTKDHTNAMVNVNDSTKPSIKALSTPATESSFTPNTWGYALTTTEPSTNTSFSAVPTASTMVADRPASDEDNLYLSFAANLNTSLPAGQYSNSVLVSVVANPLAITDLTNMVYMQDMQPEFCANTKAANGLAPITPGNEVEKRLIDARDGKEYWVSKLADQNCWMVQNLALDLNEKTLPLKPESSDVSQNWEPHYNTRSANGKLLLNLTEAEQENYDNSWNLGQVVFAAPSLGPLCNSAPTSDSTNNDGYNSVRPGATIAQSCKNFLDVSSNWQPTYTAAISLWEGKNAGYDNTDGFVAADTTHKTYDAHYLIGNYYQWGAATAGTGTNDIVSTGAAQDPSKLVNAEGSICPKGWKLPQGGLNTTTMQPFNLTGSIYQLLTSYGYPQTGSYQSNGGTYNIHGIAGSNGGQTAYKDMTFSPLRYVSAGYIALWSNSLRDVGANGLLWSATAYTSSDASYVGQPSRVYIYPSRGTNRYEGSNVRCLAR